MNKKKPGNSSSLVYSTDPSFKPYEAGPEVSTLLPSEQKLKVLLDKKQRAGKIVTLVTGFQGREEDAEALGKQLKSFCGTGGSVKEGIIIVQGDNRDKVFQNLLQSGYSKAAKI